MAHRTALTGNEAGALALKQVNPDVAAVYPITPQTELMHVFAQYVADGDVDTEMILVESEHSAMSATVGAAAAGARAITATSANGLALMWEMVYIAASNRLPIVMPVVNRALSAPINIHCDHSDTMGCRDSGWIQIYSENSQEAYDNTIQAFRIAEDPRVLLPAMVTWDGFVISHTVESLEVLDDEPVKGFVGEYEAQRSLLDINNPFTIGPLVLTDYYFEIKRQQVEAMRSAGEVILEVAEDYEKLSGRKYGYFDTFMLEDADLAIVVLGSAAGTAKQAIRELRAQGIKAGMLKLRVFRPFPGDLVAQALSHVKAIGVMDRAASFGIEGGPVYHELRSAAYGARLAIPMGRYVYGLGGRDVSPDTVKDAFADLEKVAESGEDPAEAKFLGLNEAEDLPALALACAKP